MKKDHTLLKKKLAAKACSLSTILIMAVVFAFFAIANASIGVNFLSLSNLSVIINQACFLMIVGIGQALVILSGGINLSMGAIMAFTTVMWGGLLLKSSPFPPIVGVLLVLASGAGLGLINGLLITKLHIPPFIATFAVMYTCRGLAWVYLKNRVLYPLNDSFRQIAMGRLFTIGDFTVSVPMVIALGLLTLFYIILRFTSLGRRMYFVGSNPSAAKYSGINADKMVTLVHVISGALASFAGLMYVARLNACEPGMAVKTHFEAITVSLIGGFAMSGGIGNIWGVAGGAVVVYTIQAGMNSLKLPSELQTLVNGVLIIFAVYINRKLTQKRTQLDNEIKLQTEIQEQREDCV